MGSSGVLLVTHDSK